MDSNDIGNIAITIGRQFGSGGRDIGRLVADRLGISYYDKELIMKEAQESGISPKLLENADERTPSFLENLFSWNGISTGSVFSGNTTMTLDNLYMLQSKLIRKIAAEGPCVIVGRSAEYALRKHRPLLSVFIHADIDDRVKRIMARQPELRPDQAEQLANKRDRMRAGYYEYYTDKEWGKSESYDLSLSSSRLGIEGCVELIIAAAQVRLKEQPSQ